MGKKNNTIYKKSHKLKKRKPNRSRAGDFLLYLFLLIMAILMAFPMVFAISNSMKPLDELFRYPPRLFPINPTLDNFSDLFITVRKSEVAFSRYILNTVQITVVGTIGQLLVVSMGAFILAKYEFPGRKTFFKIVIVSLMFTGYVTQIPNYLIINKMGLIDTHWAIILPAFASPMGLFLMKQFMEGLPGALIEASKIDGASEWRVFRSVVMPNVKPAWLTLIIFSVQGLWNSTASTYIYSEQKKTLVNALSQITSSGIARTGQAAAVAIIIMIVPVTVFILSQTQILETMASSGMKD